MRKNKKVAAALTAVYYYLQAEQQALQAVSQPQPAPAGGQVLQGPNPWVLSGRQTAMDRGFYMQFRMYK